MSDDKLDLKINLDIATHGQDKLEKQRKEFAQLEAELLAFARAAKAASSAFNSLGKGKTGASGAADEVRNSRAALDIDRVRYGELRKIFAFKRRMGAQEKREADDIARQLKAQERDRENALNAQAKLATRTAKARAKAEEESQKRIRDEIRETTRMRERADRQARQDADKLHRAQERAAERAARGAGQVRSGASRVAQTGAAAAAVMGFGSYRAIQRGVHTRADADEAETQLKIFNDVPDGKGGRRKLNDADIRKLRRGPGGLDKLAIGTGTSVPDTLRAYNEAAKAGLIDPMGQVRNVLKAGSALELDTGHTTKLLGTLARNMGAAATPDRMYKTLNAVGIGAREDPTQSNEIVEGLNRAQGLLAMTKGITPEDLVAMVSGGQSVGIQPGKAGTFLPAFGRSVLEGGKQRKFIDPKRFKELNFAAKKLGFNSAKEMADEFAGVNGKAVYYRIMKGLQGMAPQLRQQVADALSGGQWADEDLQIVNGIDGQIKTDQEIHDPRNARFIDEAHAQKMQSWKMLWAQSQAVFSLFWESFGVGFDGVLREINAFFVDLNGKFDYDAVSQYVRDALDGLREGLGLDTWKQGLEAIFPSDISGLGDSIKSFAKGFGEGVRAIGSTLRTIGSAFGMGGGAEALGSVSAKFLLLSTACVALAPVLGILGGLATIVLGLASVTRAAASVLGLGGAAAAGGVGGGAVAGALASVARILSGGFILSLAGAIGNMRGEIVTLMIDAVKPLVSALWQGLKSAFSLDGLKAGGSALLDELVPAPLRRWLDGDKAVPSQGADQSTTPWVDPPARGTPEAPAAQTAADKLKAEVEKQTQILRDQLAVDEKALAATQQQQSSGTSRDAQVRALLDESRRYVRGIGGSVGRAGTDGPAISHSIPGGSLGNGLTGMRRNGIIGGDNAGPDQKSGGSRSWRNNNPGNIEYGDFAKRMGAIGSDGRFAKFPSYEAGRKAQESLLFESSGYRNLTLGQAIRRWAPASENNVPAYIAAMGGDSSRRMSEYSPEQRGRLLDAMQAHEGWRPGTVAGAGGATSPGGNPADVAQRYLGMGEHVNRAAVEGFVGHNIRGAANAWCARFVGASLEAVGQRGTGSAIANSYLHWGKSIAADMVQRGDVLVDHRNKGAGATGGHVGMSTGRTRTGRNGELELEMISGNSSDQVQTTWERASKLAIRRSAEIAKAGEVAVPNAARQQPNAFGGYDALGGATPGRALGSDTPVSNRSGAGASYGRTGHNITNTVTVNGANQSPEELAGTVQRHLQDSMNRRTHDFDGFA